MAHEGDGESPSANSGNWRMTCVDIVSVAVCVLALIAAFAAESGHLDLDYLAGALKSAITGTLER